MDSADSRLPAPIHSLRRPVVRLLAAAITIITARHLITDSFHYPMLLLLSHVTIAFCLEIASRQYWPSQEAIDSFSRNDTRKHQIIHTVFVVGSLVFGYQSFLHLSNTTFWIMVVSLNWGIIGFNWVEETWPAAIGNLARGMSLAICGVLLVVQEQRLTDVGIRLLVIAVICFVTANRMGTSAPGRTFGLDNNIVPLAASIPAAIVAWIWVEVWDSHDLHLSGRIPLLVVNAIAGVIMLGPSGTIEQANNGLEDISQPWAVTSGLRRAASSIALALIAGLDNAVALSRPNTTTMGQWLAFLLASVATIDLDELCLALSSRYEQASPPREELSADILKSPLMARDQDLSVEDSPPAPRRSRMAIFSQCFIHGLAWLLFAYYMFSSETRSLPLPPSANGSTFDFDIVVARYNEPLHEIANTMNSILDVPNLHNLRTRVILYNKGDNDTSIENLFTSADEVIVRPLENVGREAETYLNHILNHDKEDFATHTLFIQAEPHDPAWMRARIQQYFVQNTGFLSLSNVGRFCANCDYCGDLSGWRIDPETMREIYAQSNPDQECGNVSLTYRGQFIVSRRRLQDVSRRALEDARERAIASKPFGYTMERLWGVMFGCPKISSSCPSLMSGYLGNLAPGGVGECQCLD